MYSREVWCWLKGETTTSHSLAPHRVCVSRRESLRRK